MTMDAHPMAFSGGPLDRADPIRIDPERLAACWADPTARIIQLDGLDPELDRENRLACRALGPSDALIDHAFLGLTPDGAPLFVSLLYVEPSEPPSFPPKVWQVAALMSAEDLAIYGGARSLADWHQRHQFCARCGAPTAPVKAGWSRQCGACQAEHFPRTDPVVIMLAEYGGRVLIGRNNRFPPRRFSALAGFVEPGETIEEAVRRELFEEAGVRAGRVDYLMSQPWPFPSQLMIACIAQAQSEEIVLDTNELSEALWVSREEVQAAFTEADDAPFMAPSPIAVAHHLLKAWLERS